nr:uncharacterized protein LOC111424570 [Onthophagus taurus]
MFKYVLCFLVIFQVINQIQTESVLVKALKPSIDTDLLSSAGQAVKRIVRSIPNEELSWTSSLTEAEYEVAKQERTGGVIGSKIDIFTLVIAVIANLVQIVMKLVAQNYLGLLYNIAGIVEAFILFFYGN